MRSYGCGLEALSVAPPRVSEEVPVELLLVLDRETAQVHESPVHRDAGDVLLGAAAQDLPADLFETMRYALGEGVSPK